MPSVTATKLQERYGDPNRDAAGPYDDAWIIVAGPVGSTWHLDPSLGDKTAIELEADSPRNIVVCYCRGRRSKGTNPNQLSRGDAISPRGKYIGNNGSGSVGVDSCKLASAPSSASD